eukprot:scaffold491754_cov29-Prasinocladus_malaysianus.AAC.1
MARHAFDLAGALDARMGSMDAARNSSTHHRAANINNGPLAGVDTGSANYKEQSYSQLDGIMGSSRAVSPGALHGEMFHTTNVLR